MVEVLWVARYDYNVDWKLNKHIHNHYQIIYFLEGSGEFFLKNSKYPIPQEGFFLIKPEEQHGLIPFKDSAVKTLDLKFFIVDDDLKKEIDSLSGIFQTENSQIKTLFLKIKEEGSEKPYHYKAMSNIYLSQILLLLLRYKTPLNHWKNKDDYIDDDILNDHSDEVIWKIQEFIKKHYAQHLSLDVLSTNLGYNKSYICQRFQKVIKCTPMHYIYWVRISKAKELITYSDYSLKQISAMTGFESIHHFARIFHKYKGITPGHCRENERTGIRKDIYLSEDFKNIDLTDKGLSQNRK